MPSPSSRPTSRPKLIVFSGLPGVGKSTLARSVSERLNAVLLRVDRIEAGLLYAGIPRSFETGLAAYLAVAEIVRDHLGLRRTTVVDAVNGVVEARRMWRELATEFGANRYVVEVVVPDPVEHRRRVETRAPSTPPLPTPSWEEVVRREYVPWSEPVLTVDATRPVRENRERIVRYVARPPWSSLPGRGDPAGAAHRPARVRRSGPTPRRGRGRGSHGGRHPSGPP